MQVEETIAARVTGHHFPGDALTATDRLFWVQPLGSFGAYAPRKVLSDSGVPGQGQYLVEQVETHWMRTGTAHGSSIDVMMPLSFFYETQGREAYDQLWSALLDAYEKIDPIE